MSRERAKQAEYGTELKLAAVRPINERDSPVAAGALIGSTEIDTCHRLDLVPIVFLSNNAFGVRRDLCQPGGHFGF
jgi:hypothetical protein